MKKQRPPKTVRLTTEVLRKESNLSKNKSRKWIDKIIKENDGLLRKLADK
jgi:hypothetical protein